MVDGGRGRSDFDVATIASRAWLARRAWHYLWPTGAMALALLVGLTVQAIARHRLDSFVILAPVVLIGTTIVIVIWYHRNRPIYADPPICEVTLPVSLLRRLDPLESYTWTDAIARHPVRQDAHGGGITIDIGTKTIHPASLGLSVTFVVTRSRRLVELRFHDSMSTYTGLAFSTLALPT